MKKTILVVVMALSAVYAAFAQSRELPRLAVVAFTGDATERDAKRVRDMVESVMVDSGHYDIISTEDIDQIIAQQKIALSSISSKENITKLERENIKYIVTGTVNREADEAFVSLRILDVKNARFIPNSPRGIIDMKSMTTIYAGVEAIASDFIASMSGNSGEVKRTAANENRQTTPPTSADTQIGAPKQVPMPANFVQIPAGTFLMGSPSSEVSRSSNETQHSVTISKPFYISKYEVTQDEYQAVMGTNPSNFKGGNLPVERVSWYDAIEYCNKRSEKEGLTLAYTISKGWADSNNTSEYDNLKWGVTWNKNANGYRLPTEAEWEYACRAGTATPFHTGRNITTSQANYDGNNPYNGNAKGTYRVKTWAVGSGTPNAAGLYDMHGNVREWCWDWYGSYASGSQTDPMSAASGSARVSRGGCWVDDASDVRSAGRSEGTPTSRSSGLGFRVVRP